MPTPQEYDVISICKLNVFQLTQTQAICHKTMLLRQVAGFLLIMNHGGVKPIPKVAAENLVRVLL